MESLSLHCLFVVFVVFDILASGRSPNENKPNSERQPLIAVQRDNIKHIEFGTFEKCNYISVEQIFPFFSTEHLQDKPFLHWILVKHQREQHIATENYFQFCRFQTFSTLTSTPSPSQVMGCWNT